MSDIITIRENDRAKAVLAACGKNTTEFLQKIIDEIGKTGIIPDIEPDDPAFNDELERKLEESEKSFNEGRYHSKEQAMNNVRIKFNELHP